MSLYAGPIVDAHIHLFDPTRPEGIPWPNAGDPIYRPTLPHHHHALSTPHRVRGAIVVEASHWPADNDWMLETIRPHAHILGFIGNLDPAAHDFHARLERLATEPLFLGLRYGNLWDRDLLADLDRPGFIDAFHALAKTGRTLDSANPDARLMRGLLRLNDAVPTLRIVIDHLPNASVNDAERRAFDRDVEELASRERVFVKLSEIPQRHEGHICLDATAYQAGFDRLWEVFGEDRTLFGSDWPNSDSLASFDDTLSLVKTLVANRSPAAMEKFFERNAAEAYSLAAASR